MGVVKVDFLRSVGLLEGQGFSLGGLGCDGIGVRVGCCGVRVVLFGSVAFLRVSYRVGVILLVSQSVCCVSVKDQLQGWSVA